jgi:PKD repeat protein
VQPDPAIITGFDLVFQGQTYVYHSITTTGEENCWEITGGLLLNDYNDSIEVMWNSAGQYSVSVRRYNTLKAASGSTKIEVTVLPIPDSSFNYTSNGNNIEFVSANEIGVDYFWDFGDGSTAQGATVNIYMLTVGATM